MSKHNSVYQAALVALVISMGGATSVLFARQGAPAAANSPLAVKVACAGQAAGLRVQIANQSGSEVAVLLGFTPAGNAGTHVVNALTVLAIRPATGADEDYVYVNPKYAAFTGGREPWTVSLAPGATHELELPLRDFISRMSYNSLDPGVADGARLVLDARSTTKPPSRLWVGRVQSVIEPCR